jgi:sodium-dependent dicarboxylate transporter 2/3/5
MHKYIILALGPLLFLVAQLLPYELISPAADKVLGIALWMVLWWITEVVSISVTALVPLTFFPLLGIMPIKEVSAFYGHPIVFLFLGGFIMALALEKVNLHKRIALSIINKTGTHPDRVLLGFLLSTALLSMWISNTATTVVMLPIAYSVIQLMSTDGDGFTAGDKTFALSLMLGIAYAANVGGIATLIGTPPNIVLAGFMESEYNYSISFLGWMMIGLPFALIMIGCIYGLLTKILYRNQVHSIEQTTSLLQLELKKLGPITKPEQYVSAIFLVAIFLWISKNYINNILPQLHLSDTSISMLAAFSCFCIAHNKEFIFTWGDTKNLPWGIIILFGGGLALANGLSQAGVIDLIGSFVSGHKNISLLFVSVLLISVMLFMTELMSNVALVAIFAPMVAGVASGLDLELLHLLIPVTMASSCAFMLPMATPPNAIVFASGHIKVKDMARTGIFLNLISILLLSLFFRFVIPFVIPSVGL